MNSKLKSRFIIIFWGVVVPVFVFGGFLYLCLKPSTYRHDEEFIGTVVSVERRTERGSSRDPQPYKVTVKNKAGEEYYCYLTKQGRYDYKKGDFFVKLKGKSYPAIFRNGKQIDWSGPYDHEPIDLQTYRKMDVDPATIEKTTETKDIEEQAVRLITEASQLWELGNQQGAIENCKKALKIRQQLYGNDHPLVSEVQNKLAAARQAATGQ